MTQPTEAEARLSLQGVELAQRRVIDRIGVPWWYWWGLALCWVGFGVLTDIGAPWWLLVGAYLVFGAAHATIPARLLAGRQQSSDVRVRAVVTGHRGNLFIGGFTIVLVLLTITLAVLLDADGAGHPATWASIWVGSLIVLGGPRLMLTIRDNAARRAAQ
jgi:hypothetical protein